MPYCTDDPHVDFDRWEADEQKALKKLPTCDYCGETIMDDYLYDINGDIICESCMKKHFRKPVEDYIN